MQAQSGEWMKEYGTPERLNSYSTEYLPAAEIIRQSIRRSWTISSKFLAKNPLTFSIFFFMKFDHKNCCLPIVLILSDSHNESTYTSRTQNKTHRTSAEYCGYVTVPNGFSECNDYINPVINQIPFNSRINMDYQNNEYYERSTPQRRVLRQSTLPSNLQHTESYYKNNVNLMPPASPNQQISPQYSPYNTDSEDIMDTSNQDLRQSRYPIRRQSTLPSRPNENYLSTSPNRNFSRSPEKNDCEQRYPPFVRQSTFPSNASADLFGMPMHRPKILPTSPNRMGYNKSPEHCSEPDFHVKRHSMMRQNTLPNPSDHVKLLPTSPPKRQPSPQYMKRSPEILRQNTLPNPECLNSLGVPQHSKFLPISPRNKQRDFMFPPVPRQFLSQQHVPNVAEEAALPSASSIPIVNHLTHHAKMMKNRSHSNEEYGVKPEYGTVYAIPNNKQQTTKITIQ